MAVFLAISLLPSCTKTNLNFKPMYREPIYDVVEEHPVYAEKVKGYWKSYPETGEDFGTIYLGKVSQLGKPKKLDLDMDVYYPQEPVSQAKRPLLLLIHGGAFYNGDKQAIGYPEMGHYFAERGYVVASINYRLGFMPLAADVDRAGYRAVQDAHAAVSYLINHADEYGIDTAHIFAAGTSAGAITALNLAFMDEENRPVTTREHGVKGWVSEATKGIVSIIDQGVQFVGRLFNQDWGLNPDGICERLGLDSDLGPINSVSGASDRAFHIQAVVNMWGAVHDVSMLKNSPQTSILSFHGDDDHIVPYGYGYPFDGLLDPYVVDIIDGLPVFMQPVAGWIQAWVTDGKLVNEWAFNPMYGSKSVHDKAIALGMRSELHTLEGGGHSLHVEEGRDALSPYFYDIILPNMNRFLCEEMVGGELVQIVEESDGWYKATGIDNVDELHWMVKGGKIVKKDGCARVKVRFDDDVYTHSVIACGKYGNGLEFRETMEK